MLPELGQLALILALLLSAVQFVLPLIGAHIGNQALIRVARPAAAGQFVFVAMAFGVLTYAFLNQDFSVAYVAQNSNLVLPWYYRLSAVWGAHEGSLVLWILILNLWTIAVAAFSRRLPDEYMARVIGVLGFVSLGQEIVVLPQLQAGDARRARLEADRRGDSGNAATGRAAAERDRKSVV